ncbi:Membrane transport protein [Pseudovibrio sp. Ad46]|uniref:AEC family transporter n=1 Tax=Pseudovibrio sp. Ad46 TaxID=989432 RepID=UPI0007AEDCB0|nr:AEC family transporter [Pseudovibrio sp. Ad46]KZK96110.1 Membrane transport protein [Pseudovibrio sp. Ad46]
MIVQVFFVVFPIFALVGIGYVVANVGYLDRSLGDILSKFCVNLLIPILLFRSLGSADLDGISPWGYWATYYGSMIVVAFLGGLLVRIGFKREARAAVIAGLTASFSNTVLVGIPLIDAVYGAEGTLLISLLIVFHAPLTALTSSVLMERAVVIDGHKAPRSKKELLIAVGKGLLANPILYGVVGGLLWNVSGLEIPKLADDVLAPLAKAASPVALVAVGMSMVNYGIRGNLAIGSVLAIIKSILMPFVVFVVAAHVVGLPSVWVGVATLIAACPTGVFSFIIANQFGTGHAMSTNGIAITTGISVFTVSFWLWFIQVQGY